MTLSYVKARTLATKALLFDFNINVDIAKNLGCPVLIVGRGDLNRDLEAVVTPVMLAYESFAERECQILGIIVNRTTLWH